MASEGTLRREQAERFWRDARARVLEANRQVKSNETLDFAGVVFREDPNHKYFDGLPFRAPVTFAGAKFECFNPFNGCEFDDETDWTNCRFTGSDDRFLFARCRFISSADFRGCAFVSQVTFRGVEFSEEVDFTGATFGKCQLEADDRDKRAPTTFVGVASFCGCTFQELNCDGAMFKSDVSFADATFAYWTRFRETRFCGTVTFSRAVFGKHRVQQSRSSVDLPVTRNVVDFTKTQFEYDAFFDRVEFRCDGVFTDSHFMHDVKFDGVVVHGQLAFRCQCEPGGDIRMRGVQFKLLGEGRDAFRAAKNAAHARGDGRAEGDYHFFEQCAVNARDWVKGRFCTLPWSRKSKIRAAASHLFGRWVYGYGERPQRVVLTGLVVIVICASAYRILEAVEGASSFWSNLYFSVVTFTTLGYGDLQPKPGTARFLAGSEALIGAALIALLVVSLTRRYTR